MRLRYILAAAASALAIASGAARADDNLQTLEGMPHDSADRLADGAADRAQG